MAVGCGDAETEHDGDVGCNASSFFEGDAGVVGVEDCLDEEKVDATIAQGFYLFGIGCSEITFGEGVSAVSDTGGAAGGANAAGDEAGMFRR